MSPFAGKRQQQHIIDINIEFITINLILQVTESLTLTGTDSSQKTIHLDFP